MFIPLLPFYNKQRQHEISNLYTMEEERKKNLKEKNENVVCLYLLISLGMFGFQKILKKKMLIFFMKNIKENQI